MILTAPSLDVGIRGRPGSWEVVQGHSQPRAWEHAVESLKGVCGLESNNVAFPSRHLLLCDVGKTEWKTA